MALIDLQYIEYWPEADESETLDPVFTREHPLYTRKPLFIRAFALRDDARLQTGHGTEYAKKGDFVLVGVDNDIAHACNSFVFHSAYELITKHDDDVVTDTRAVLHGTVDTIANVLYKAQYVMRNRKVSSFWMETFPGDRIECNIVFE